MLKKSKSVKSEYRVNITAGVSAHGSGHPPILDDISPATRIGIAGNLSLRMIVNEIKVNINTTLKLFINNDMKYIEKGSKIAIRIFLFFDIVRSLSPIASKKPLF